MVLTLRNRMVNHTTSNENLTVEKLSRQGTRQLVKNSESVVIPKEKHNIPISTENILRNNELLHGRKSTRRQILADKTNNSDSESQVVGSKSKIVNSTPKSLSKTLSTDKVVNNVGSKKKNSPRNLNNKELCLKKQNCIYSHQADTNNESLKISEKCTVYEFEADENDPFEKKRKGLKRKKKIRTQKKLGCTVEEEIQAKNKLQYLKKFKTLKLNKRKAIKLTDSKSKGEICGRQINKTNTIVGKKNQEGGREKSRKQISPHLRQSRSFAGQQSLATPLEEEHHISATTCFTGLPLHRREMSPEIFNIAQFGFTTSTAEKSTNNNRCTVEKVSGNIGNLHQSKCVLLNPVQTPLGKTKCSVGFTPTIHGLNNKSKIPRDLLSLFSPVQEIRYDNDIAEEIDILSPIRAPNATEAATNMNQTNACTVKSSCKKLRQDHSVGMETMAQICIPSDTNISCNHGTYKPSSCKQSEDFNISNCFGFDSDEDILPRAVPTKLNSAHLNQTKCVEELPLPFRANIVIPRRPLYPRINCKYTSKMEDQKQDPQSTGISDPNVSIFDLEEVECAADTSVTDTGPSCVSRADKGTLMESSLSEQSPKCYSVPKRLRPVRSKPIIEESENDDDDVEPILKRHKKSHRTVAQEKELNKWATSFNSMCEEVDSFELFVE